MSIQNRYEFVYLFDVTNGNPNGDPDAGNMPRLDPESSKGLVTDVCLKRKIRNFIEMTEESNAGYEIYVKEKSILNLQNKKAYEALSIVPESKKINELLREFQLKKFHLAIVVDEFGSTSGIVTLEDIMEEIIGDIQDEFDDEESENKKIDDYTYIFEGKTMINDVCKIIGLPGDTFERVRGDSDSLAGLVLEIAGEFPQVEEEVVSGDFTFIPLAINKNRIDNVKVVIRQSTATL